MMRDDVERVARALREFRRGRRYTDDDWALRWASKVSEGEAEAVIFTLTQAGWTKGK